MIRLPAEWEPQSMVQLTLPHHQTDWADVLDEVMPCFVAIATAVAKYEKVLIVSPDTAAVKPLFAHISEGKLIFAEVPTNDTWARDHGGITVFDNESPVILDFVFNGWGLKFPAYYDNLITAALGAKSIFKAKLKHGGIVLEGGGIESDGQGTLLTTSECLLSPNRNPHLSKAEIEAHLQQVFGVSRVLWLDHGYLAGDDTDSHIDTLARLCDPHTIAYVKCTDREDEHFTALEKMEAQLQTFKTADGNPYRLIPLPWPDPCFASDGHRLPATYANFLIINGAVLLPVYEVPQDEEAIQILKSIFPDREIIPVNCRPLIGQHGSLHCVTMQYPEETI